jgi:Tol biopolymer transport system component
MSPNSKVLAVTRALPGCTEGAIALYRYPPGQLVRTLTSGTMDSEPAWSPDGSRLAFVRNASTRSARIYTISANGGRPQLLVAKARAVTWGR